MTSKIMCVATEAVMQILPSAPDLGDGEVRQRCSVREVVR